jgi:hypothetical protein
LNQYKIVFYCSKNPLISHIGTALIVAPGAAPHAGGSVDNQSAQSKFEIEQAKNSNNYF